jgi:DNA-binding MarR family transcriptional regulator
MNFISIYISAKLGSRIAAFPARLAIIMDHLQRQLEQHGLDRFQHDLGEALSVRRKLGMARDTNVSELANQFCVTWGAIHKHIQLTGGHTEAG